MLLFLNASSQGKLNCYDNSEIVWKITIVFPKDSI